MSVRVAHFQGFLVSAPMKFTPRTHDKKAGSRSTNACGCERLCGLPEQSHDEHASHILQFHAFLVTKNIKLYDHEEEESAEMEELNFSRRQPRASSRAIVVPCNRREVIKLLRLIVPH